MIRFWREIDNTLINNRSSRLFYQDNLLEISDTTCIMFASKYQDTPLHLSAGKGHTDTCSELIKLGADVNAKNYVSVGGGFFVDV